MTIAEVAKLIDKSEQSVRRMIKAGKLKAAMVNGRYEIREGDIPDSLFDSKPIVTDSQALVEEISNLKGKIETQEAIIKEKDEALEKARQDAAEASARHDTIVLQLTRQLEQSQRLLEYHERPWWRRWFAKKEKEH